MRSELVFTAKLYIPNAFLLTKLVSKATRKLHRPNTRIEDTTNDVFVRCGNANPIADGTTCRLLTAIGLASRKRRVTYSAQCRSRAA